MSVWCHFDVRMMVCHRFIIKTFEKVNIANTFSSKGTWSLIQSNQQFCEIEMSNWITDTILKKKLNRMANSSEILPKYVTFIQTKSHKKISAIELIIFEKIWKKNRRFIVTPPPLGNRVKRNQRKDKRSKTDPLGMTCIRPVFH